MALYWMVVEPVGKPSESRLPSVSRNNGLLPGQLLTRPFTGPLGHWTVNWLMPEQPSVMTALGSLILP